MTTTVVKNGKANPPIIRNNRQFTPEEISAHQAWDAAQLVLRLKDIESVDQLSLEDLAVALYDRGVRPTFGRWLK